MVKESVRRCSHCGHDGHNSRTCNGKGCLKLFGVTIVAQKEDESIRKCKSTGDLVACNGEHGGVDAGYLSDGLIQSERAHERKKGVPWTEEEHRSFLAGLEHIGKGDWRGISKNYVPSRTPTQVASHAQKYFIRLAATDKKKRRSSLFDMSFKEPEIHHSPPPPPPELPVSPPDKTAEISQQASTSAQLTSPLAAPPVLLLATSYGVPDSRPMPYTAMVGVTSNG